ncbi:MAG: zf-TFIIB domain-containing protein [Microbacteriaceae bacterium]|nr:zf-TFIIB domain-containing protein [Microbacteriaceae bacterium]
MNCPIDSTELVMSERGGVEIDYCPKCRGVWLDRGELDKIVDRAQLLNTPVSTTGPRNDNFRGQSSSERSGKQKKRDNWLGELFG